MLTGVDFRQAIKYWTQGREVIVIDRSSLHASGGYDNFPFEDLFRNVELLADVPAVEDPEFRQEVEDMIQESDSEGTETPPLTGPEKKDAPAGKPKKELALELAAKGMPVKEIANQIGVKYGKLTGDWKAMLSAGFDECMRVLKPNGVLVFKWSEVQFPLSEILPLFSQTPLFGNRCRKRGNKTHWLCFMKD